MIISASRRTDIPAYYSQWFSRRIREGHVLVRNPMNPHQVSRISLSPEDVDGIVFWTKNPAPMLDKLDVLREYMYYFQCTITPYGRDVEPGLPDKERAIIPAFQRLSDQIGPQRVIWRYDPILLSGRYSLETHIRSFERMARQLHPYTKKCTISFIDLYRNTARNMAGLAMQPLTAQAQNVLAGAFAEIAHGFGLEIDTCAEEIDLEKYGISHARCIDGRLFEQLLGCPMQAPKDKNQRAACGCMESVDIGAYNTCKNGCVYCYANYMKEAVGKNAALHDPLSPLLTGHPDAQDRVTERKVRLFAQRQTRMEI